MRIKTFSCLVALLLTLCLAAPAIFAAEKPNILVIWADDVGYWNVSHNNRGMMGYKTPNIDRIASEGLSFTDYYGEQSCTAGRAAFITGQAPVRTGLTKVGMPGAAQVFRKKIRLLLRYSNHLATQLVNLAKTILVIEMNSFRPFTVLTSFSVISII